MERASLTIRTERLVLRELRVGDWKTVHKYASDPEVVRFMDWGSETIDDTKAFISRAIAARKDKTRTAYTLAIALQTSGELIGSCGFYVSNVQNREGWIGYCLNPIYWNQGYGTETAKALVNFGFQKLKLHRVFATCDPSNFASIHVLEKAGMKLEGHMREHKWSKGSWRDSLIYAILENEIG